MMNTPVLNPNHQVSLLQISPPSKPHFHRIIHPALLRDGKLVAIPERFLRKYGKDLSNFIFLTLPNGAVWRVELMKGGDDEVLLGSGWQEFAEYYSIGYGHFLLFRYEGNSHFHILIFDMSASEIEYPSTNAIHNEERNANNEDDVSLEISDDFPAGQAAKRKDIIVACCSEQGIGPNNEDDASLVILDDFPAGQAAKRKDIIVACCSQHEICPIYRDGSPTSKKKGKERRTVSPSPETDETSDLHSFHPRFQSEGTQASGRLDGKEGSGRMHLSQILPPVAAGGQVGALQRAEAFKSENPFFIVTMRPSYISRKYCLNVPLSFVKRHFQKDNNNVTLRVSHGRSWSLEYFLAEKSVKIWCGWRKFVKDNNMGAGDVCAFELLKSTGNLLKVVIFRKNEAATSRLLN